MQFSCAYTETEGSYGTVQVNDSLMASHTPATADANDVFTIENGMLKVTTSTTNGTDYALNAGTLSVNNGFTGTLTSTATFNNDVQTREIDFIYDHNGMRTAKIVSENGRVEITEYTLHGKLITHLTKRTVDENGAESTEELHFFYDAQSRPAFVEFDGEIYRYVHNLQDDIVAIVDAAGNLVVEYKYDAWGKPFSTTGCLKTSLGQLNSFRYRGYVWDEESNLYYLRSRHYDAIRNRFMGSDGILPHALLMVNCYAYCNNNPVVKADGMGLAPYTVLLNVYTDKDYGNDYGHYDITILSSAEGENIEYSFMGVQKSTSRMTISYGPGGAIDKEKGEYVGMLSFFEGDNLVIESKLDKVSQYVINDDLSQEELDSFLQWISESFIDLGTMESFKKNECKGYRYKVTDNRFAVYCIANNSYCGSAAGRLLVRIRNYKPMPRLSGHHGGL